MTQHNRHTVLRITATYDTELHYTTLKYTLQQCTVYIAQQSTVVHRIVTQCQAGQAGNFGHIDI